MKKVSVAKVSAFAFALTVLSLSRPGRHVGGRRRLRRRERPEDVGQAPR